jgi:hypothetical protein
LYHFFGDRRLIQILAQFLAYFYQFFKNPRQIQIPANRCRILQLAKSGETAQNESTRARMFNLAKMRKGTPTMRPEFGKRPESLPRHPPQYNVVRPGPWSAFVYVLIIVLISYCRVSAILEPPGAILGPCCGNWGYLGAILGPSWGQLGGHLGAILGPYWGQVGAILGNLGAILGYPGAILQLSSPSWTIWKPSWDHSGAIYGHLGPSGTLHIFCNMCSFAPYKPKQAQISQNSSEIPPP